MERLFHRTNNPWILSNAFDAQTGQPFASCEYSRVLIWNGVRVGIMGLIEKEWLATLPCVNPSAIRYVDFVEKARELAAELRSAGVDMVVALTHMRVPNDELLAREVSDLQAPGTPGCH